MSNTTELALRSYALEKRASSIGDFIRQYMPSFRSNNAMSGAAVGALAGGGIQAIRKLFASERDKREGRSPSILNGILGGAALGGVGGAIGLPHFQRYLSETNDRNGRLDNAQARVRASLGGREFARNAGMSLDQRMSRDGADWDTMRTLGMPTLLQGSNFMRPEVEGRPVPPRSIALASKADLTMPDIPPYHPPTNTGLDNPGTIPEWAIASWR